MNTHVTVIAEAGVNHNGEIEIARKMVDEAVLAGADAIKFQAFKAERISCRSAKKATYQILNTGNEETQFEMLKKLEFSESMHKQLSKYCENKNILFLSSPFDIESIQMLVDLGMSIFKIPSGEITNLPYLREVAKQKKKIILSTGMSNMDEVQAAIKILRENGGAEISLLHCTTQYPTPPSDVNLLAMVEMMEKLKIPVGYSDHTLGIEISLAAVALGACIIEKHFTLDRSMEGPDHKASVEPHELRQMIEGIRKIEVALGNPIKRVSASEKDNLNIVRKSIVASDKIKKGELFTEKNLTTKRPGIGISPMKWDDIIGLKAKKDYEVDEIIQL